MTPASLKSAEVGEPMGNGYPVAALVGRAELFDAFGARAYYFNTFGGAPVATAAAGAVLDVIERDDLMKRACEVGDYIRTGFAWLGNRHPLIGDIRGSGLWVGIELVRDRSTRESATSEAALAPVTFTLA